MPIPLDEVFNGGKPMASTTGDAVPDTEARSDGDAGNTTAPEPTESTQPRHASDDDDGDDDTYAGRNGGPPESIPYAAYRGKSRKLSESNKRNREIASDNEYLRRRLAETEDRLSKISGAHQQAPKKIADDDDYDETKLLADLPGAFRRRDERYRAQQDSFRYEASEELARELKPDYDKVVTDKAWRECLDKVPYARERCHNAKYPALMAYRIVKELQSTQRPQFDDAQIEAEVQRRFEEKEKNENLQRLASAPKPLTTTRGTAVTTKKVFAGPTPMEHVFKRSY